MTNAIVTRCFAEDFRRLGSRKRGHGRRGRCQSRWWKALAHRRLRNAEARYLARADWDGFVEVRPVTCCDVF